MRAIALMPDEAFGWLVAEWMQGRPFPDGLGGFQDASRAAIVELKAAANEFLSDRMS